MNKIGFSFSRRDKAKSIILALAISAGIVLLTFAMYEISSAEGPFTNADRILKTFILEQRNRRYPNLIAKQYDSIIIIRIDDRSLKALDMSWPIPRSIYGRLLEKIERAGATAVGLDIIFPDPFILPKEDDLFARSIGRLKKSVFAFSIEPGRSGFEAAMPNSKLLKAIDNTRRDHPLGFVLEPADRDGVVRRSPLFILRKGQERLYSFDLLLYSMYLGAPPDVVIKTLHLDEGTLVIEGESSPTLYSYINFTGSGSKEYDESQNFSEAMGDAREAGEIKALLSEKINCLSLADVLSMTEEDLRLQFFSDPETGKPKRVIVLIGATGTAMQETKVTPIGAMQGIEVHANILMSMLDNSFLHPSPPWLWVALILGGGLLLGVVLPWLNPRLGTLLLIALFTGTLYGAYNMLARHNIIVDNLSPVLLNLVAVTAGVHLFHYLSVRKAQSRLSSLLKELAPLPSPLIEEYMRRSEGALDLGGKKQTLTILFCDIRGYTDMSERMDPVSVMDTLNEYYSAMGAIFQKHGGMIFDYIGDAQMVVFGIADGSEDNHAVAACLTGLDMGEKIEEMRRQWHLQGKNTFEVGVGISTGPVSLGLIGSSQRKQFTAIGDTTNVAARIQGLSAQLNSKVTITQATYEMAKDSIAVEELKPVKVKGKAEPINVYKVIGVKERDLSRN